MFAYLDESGDLGWSLDKSLGRGGSSQYLTLAFLFASAESIHAPKREIKKLYKKVGINPRIELKGAKLTPAHCEFFVGCVARMLARFPKIKIVAVTVKKRNVKAHIRRGDNALYNWIVAKLIIPDYIGDEPILHLIPDPRSIKVTHAKSLFDYVRSILWFDLGLETEVHEHHIDSNQSLGLKFCDVIAHIIWSKYEFGENEPADTLIQQIDNRQLFF